MSKQILNLDDLKGSSTKIFFDNYSGFQRVDRPTYGSAVTLEENMRNAFWNPNEIKMTDDQVKFFQMPRRIQNMMCSIWFYQTLMDSTQNRGLEDTLGEIVSNPEYEMLFKTWAYFEQIHSISYSHIIRSLFTANGSDVFEENMNNQDIINRVRTEVEYYNKIAESTDNLEGTEEDCKNILKLILHVYALEGIKFYASFLLTYCVNDFYGSIPGATRIIKLINYDEDTHTHASTVLLKDLKNDPKFKELIESQWFKDTAHEVFRHTYNDECNFAKYLLNTFNTYELISEVEMETFLQYYVDKRLTDIEVDSMFNTGESALVTWFKEQKDLNKINSALQESDMAVYNKSILEMDF